MSEQGPGRAVPVARALPHRWHTVSNSTRGSVGSKSPNPLHRLPRKDVFEIRVPAANSNVVCVITTYILDMYMVARDVLVRLENPILGKLFRVDNPTPVVASCALSSCLNRTQPPGTRTRSRRASLWQTSSLRTGFRTHGDS